MTCGVFFLKTHTQINRLTREIKIRCHFNVRLLSAQDSTDMCSVLKCEQVWGWVPEPPIRAPPAARKTSTPRRSQRTGSSCGTSPSRSSSRRGAKPCGSSRSCKVCVARETNRHGQARPPAVWNRPIPEATTLLTVHPRLPGDSTKIQ